MKLAKFFPVMFALIILRKHASAILHGTPATEHMFKYVVSLWRGNFFVCGGAIIKETHILTAAHCVYENQNPSAYTVRAGATYWFSLNVVAIGVETIRIHPDFQYSDGQLLNDVAILTLTDSLEFGNRIQNVALPNYGDTLPHCDLCQFAGWGATLSAQGPQSPDLFYARFRILQPTHCREYVPGIRHGQLCAKDPFNRVTSAPGDSGGPLVCNGVVYGVHSIGCCEADRPAIMTNVIEYLSFIRPAVPN